MNIEVPQRPAVPATEDARALLSRLYREIGVTAVAVALDVPLRTANYNRPSVQDIPVILRAAVME